MALIDVPALIFDPATRRAALEEAATLIGLDNVPDEQFEAIEAVLDQFAPSPPEDVADYLDVLGRYVATLAVGLNQIGVGSLPTLFGQIAALDARIDALEA